MVGLSIRIGRGGGLLNEAHRFTPSSALVFVASLGIPTLAQPNITITPAGFGMLASGVSGIIIVGSTNKLVSIGTSLLAALSLGLPSVVLPSVATSEAYIRPVAHGTGDGSSWANAAAFTSLGSLVNGAAAGAVIYIRADEGPYTGLTSTPQTFTHGGTNVNSLIIQSTYSGNGKPYFIKNPSLNWNPITIRGVDVNKNLMYATLIGNRFDWTLPADPEAVTNVIGLSVGGELINLSTGANNLKFEFLDFQRIGEPAVISIRPGVTVSNIWISHCKGYNVRRMVDQEATSTSTVVDGMYVDHVDVVGFSKHCFRWRGMCKNIVVEDCNLNSGRQTNDNFAVGIGLDSNAQNLTYQRVIVTNCHDDNGTGYWNADGFSGESTNFNIQLIDCEAYGCTDGGFDFKSTPAFYMTRCKAGDNKFQFRIWTRNVDGDRIMDACHSYSPHKRGGSGSHAHIETLGTTAVNGAAFKLLVNNHTFHGAAIDSSTIIEPHWWGTTLEFHHAILTDDAGHSQTLNGSKNIANTITAGNMYNPQEQSGGSDNTICTYALT